MLTPIIEFLLAICIGSTSVLGGMMSLAGADDLQVTVVPAAAVPAIVEPAVNEPAAVEPAAVDPALTGEYTAIERGNSGEAVEMLQNRLTELGYYTGKITGKMDSATQLAYKKFEKANGFSANGIASPEEQQVLYSAEAVAAQ